jgi:hypothetical protein
MAKISLGKPITIGGEEVVVVRDVVGDVQKSILRDNDSDTYAIVEQKGPDGRPPIYVSENDLTRLRDDYPSINVYGLWQILFFNGVIQFGSPLVTFPLTDTGGLYLLMDNATDFHSPSSIVASGEYINGFIPDNTDVDINTASVISIDVTKLKLPKQPAYTRVELSGKLKAENKRRWLVVSSLCGLIIVCAIAVNYGMQTVYKSRMADYATKKTLIAELNARVKALSAERLISRPDDSFMLTQLFKVFELYPNAITPVSTDELKIGFNGAHMLITPQKASVDPAVLVRGIKTELQPDLSYKVSFAAQAEAEAEDSGNNKGESN